MQSLPEELTAKLRTVRSVGAITGAGISAESGIRPYRGKGGLYDDPEEGERTVLALTGTTLAHDPDLTWRTLGVLARQAGVAEPNPGHRALAAIEDDVERFVLLTQNVDDLHRAAGSRNVIQIHGDIFAARCLGCGAAETLDRERLAAIDNSPRCAACDGTLRPDAVLFGELLPLDKVERIRRELHDDPPDLLIVAGTSALFPYITDPVLIARRKGKLTVEINPEPTLLSEQVDYALRGPAGVFLPLIESALTASSNSGS